MIVRAGRATIALVSCVKSKLPYAAPAEDLYVSDLFKSMRKYAESIAGDWFILSAAHGLLRRRQVIEPYERTLRTMDKQERMAWARRVQVQLGKSLPPASKEGLNKLLASHSWLRFGRRFRGNESAFLARIPETSALFRPSLRS